MIYNIISLFLIQLQQNHRSSIFQRSTTNTALRWSYLCLPLDGVHSADELTVRLEEQQQLKVQLIEPAT